MGEPIEPPPRPRLLAARQFHRDRHTSARRRGLLQVGKFEVVVSLGQHDLLQDALESRPHRSKLLRLLGGEGRPDFGDEVVDRPRRRAVLQGLDGVEPEVEDVEVGAVGRLADELDVPTISGALPDDVRVVVQVVRWSVVVLGPVGPMGIFPFTEVRQAVRNSARGAAGTCETKCVEVTKERYKEKLIQDVIAAIKRDWPRARRGETIWAQHDNAHRTT